MTKVISTTTLLLLHFHTYISSIESYSKFLSYFNSIISKQNFPTCLFAFLATVIKSGLPYYSSQSSTIYTHTNPNSTLNMYSALRSNLCLCLFLSNKALKNITNPICSFSVFHSIQLYGYAIIYLSTLS